MITRCFFKCMLNYRFKKRAAERSGHSPSTGFNGSGGTTQAFCVNVHDLCLVTITA